MDGPSRVGGGEGLPNNHPPAKMVSSAAEELGDGFGDAWDEAEDEGSHKGSHERSLGADG